LTWADAYGSLKGRFVAASCRAVLSEPKGAGIWSYVPYALAGNNMEYKNDGKKANY
jgi:hypothetical protein